MTNQEYIRFMTERLINHFIHKEKLNSSNDENKIGPSFLQQWFGLLPMYFGLWYKK